MTIDSSRLDRALRFPITVVGASAYAADRAHAATDQTVTAPGARKLAELVEQLRRSPRCRGFKTVPMIVQEPDFWDDEALRHVIAYQGNRKQVWDNTEIAGPWLNLMRNALNAQIFAFDHVDYLAVSATHGTAHLALFDQSTWDKYELAAFTDVRFRTNTLIAPNTAPAGFSENEIRRAFSAKAATPSRRCKHAALSSSPVIMRSGKLPPGSSNPTEIRIRNHTRRWPPS